MQRPVKATSGAASLALGKSCDYLATSRPTAVNLFWALDRMRRTADRTARQRLAAADRRSGCWRRPAPSRKKIARCAGPSAASAPSCSPTARACSRIATPAAWPRPITARRWPCSSPPTSSGKRLHVYADETRPLLQGARLTAWELPQRGIDVTLICDSMAAQVMREGRVQAVVVGADRIAANGDTANKIGTYGVALLAAAHEIPFYVAAPSSTFDLSLASGEAIPIEQRDPREITHGFGRQTAPDGVRVYNPAFDVTPARLIRAIICERGLIQPVDRETIAAVLRAS